MSRKIIGISWDRESRNNINDNFAYLFGEGVIDDIEDNISRYIKAGSITPDKVSFIRAGKNIFNKFDVVDGRLASAGNLIPNDTDKTSNYTLIDPNTTYITNKSIWCAQYDENKEFVKWDFVSLGNVLNTESNTVYIRISTRNGDVESLQVEKGTTITDYEPYTNTLSEVEYDEVVRARKSDAKAKTFLYIKDRFEEIERDIINLNPDDEGVVDDDVAEQVFVDEMNKKAGLLGCENLRFKNSSGLTAAGQLTSPKDFAIISRHAAGIDELNKVWGAKTYEVNVKGSNPRKVPISTTVQDEVFEQDYKILGGKTGTLGIVKNLSLVAQHRDKGHILVGTVLRANDDRWTAMKQLLDETINVIEDNPSEGFTVDSIGACSAVLPANPLLHTSDDLNEVYIQNNDQLTSPASLTKILTSMVLIENIPNLSESFVYKSRDAQEDDLHFNEGDQVTFKDALYLMMLQSNNTTAKAVARVVGQKIVKARGYVQ